MDVYVVTEHSGWGESNEVTGVYATVEAAKAACPGIEWDQHGEDDWTANYRAIIRWTVTA